MKLIHNQQPSAQDVDSANASFVPMATIRKRVAKIKRRWTPEVAKSRAVEGQRRREELECLLVELLDAECEDGEELADFPTLSLVG